MFSGSFHPHVGNAAFYFSKHSHHNWGYGEQILCTPFLNGENSRKTQALFETQKPDASLLLGDWSWTIVLGVQECIPNSRRRGGQETLTAEEMTFYSWLSPIIGLVLEPSATQLETESRLRHMLDPHFRDRVSDQAAEGPGITSASPREGGTTQRAALFAQLRQLI